MLISTLAAAFAVVALAVVFVARRAVVRSRRRLMAFAEELARSLDALSETLELALRRSESSRVGAESGLALTLDLNELLAYVAERAALRTGAQAAAVRVGGPGEATAVGCFGSEDVAQLLEATLRPPDRRPFRAMTINWTFPPGHERDPRGFRSVLLVPVLEDGLETGAIAAYAMDPAAFRPEHARALEALAEEVAGRIATARRFTRMRLRATTGRRGNEAGTSAEGRTDRLFPAEERGDGRS